MTVAAWILAALLAAAAAALIGWGLIGDRARGRRRCPRCFYPAPGGSRLCTECGHEAPSERRLLRTRRRWRAVAIGAALLLLGAAAAGTGLVRQHGAWGWAPDALLTQLLWAGNEHIDDEIRARIRAGRLTRTQAGRVATSATSMIERSNEAQRDRGLAFLEGLARNSFVLVNDPPDAHRPMLEELQPRPAMDALLPLLDADDPQLRARVLELLSHYRSVDRRAGIELLARLSSDDATEQRAARQALARTWREGELVERGPGLPSFAVYALHGSRLYDEAPPDEVNPVLEAFSRKVAALQDEPDQLLAFALDCAESADDITMLTMGLWLHGYLSGHDARSRALALQYASDERRLVRTTAIQMLEAQPFDDEVFAALDAALREPDRYSPVSSAAIRTAASFGEQAAPLASAFLHLARAHGGGGSSAFAEDYLAIGGDPAAMLEAILGWVENNESRVHYMAFWWLLDLEIHNTAAAERIARLYEGRQPLRPHDDVVSYAALASAAMGGDRQWATRTILDRLQEPPQTIRNIVGSASYALVLLCRRGLADPELLADRYLDNPESQLACLELLGRMGPAAAPVADRIAAMQNHPDPEVASAASDALARTR